MASRTVGYYTQPYPASGPSAKNRVLDLVELHRTALAQRTGRPIDAEDWRLGFQFSLQDLLVTRFPMYALAHRVCPQRFLSRILRTWQVLDERLSEDTRHGRQEVAGSRPSPCPIVDRFGTLASGLRA